MFISNDLYDNYYITLKCISGYICKLIYTLNEISATLHHNLYNTNYCFSENSIFVPYCQLIKRILDPTCIK